MNNAGPARSPGESPLGLQEARARTATVDPIPSDTMIVSADRTGNFELYLVRMDGTPIRRITLDLTVRSFWPRISPDRRRILFYRAPREAPPQDYSSTSLWVMNADGSDQRVLRPNGMDGWVLQGHAEWSPDGREIVMFGGPHHNPQIYVTDDEGRNARPVTDRPGRNIDPSWAPDGQSIAFVGCAAAICFDRDWEIFTIPATGGVAKQLTSNSVRDHDPYFSPDGSRIAWISETEPDAFKPGYGVWSILLMNTDGADKKNLTNDRAIPGQPMGLRSSSRAMSLARRTAGASTASAWTEAVSSS
jgi:TolB protein